LRRRPVGVAAAVLVVAAAVALIAWLVPVGEVRGSPRSAAAGPPSLGAEPTTADPCALMSVTSYEKFGDPKLDEDFGSFARCDVLVGIGENDDVDVAVELDDADDEDNLPALTVRKDDDEEAADLCARTVIIGDGHIAEVDATTYNDSGTTAADLCAMADVAAAEVVAVLRRGPVPRDQDELPAESIANSNACAMADEQVVALVPDVDPTDPMPGFGPWYCRWSDPEDGPSSLLLQFDRNPPYGPDEGREIRLGDRDAVVFPRGFGDDTCEVSVIHRRYVNEYDEDMIEALLVVVYGDGPTQPLCDTARQVASRAAGNLPAV
jgi:hypothetical protein